VTGFGLMGHANEMAQGSGLLLELWAESVPVLPGALEQAREGIIPGGAYRNRDYLSCRAGVDADVPVEVADVCYDPQTAGGLLIAIGEEAVPELLRRLEDKGVPGRAVGRAAARQDLTVHLKRRA